MTTPELLKSWQMTEGYLTMAYSQMSALAATQEVRQELNQVCEFIEHNELGVASDWLLDIAKEKHWDSIAILSHLALAQASMGRTEEQMHLDARLSELRGEPYVSRLPDDR